MSTSYGGCRWGRRDGGSEAKTSFLEHGRKDSHKGILYLEFVDIYQLLRWFRMPRTIPEEKWLPRRGCGSA
jgi:hypothetical protein